MEIWTILPAIITGAVTITVCLVNNYYNQKSLYESQQRHMDEINAQNQQAIAMINLELKTLTDSVEKHNNVIERVFVLEGKAENFKIANQGLSQDVKDLNERINNIIK